MDSHHRLSSPKMDLDPNYVKVFAKANDRSVRQLSRSDARFRVHQTQITLRQVNFLFHNLVI